MIVLSAVLRRAGMLALALLLAAPVVAQEESRGTPEESEEPTYGTGAGFEILLTNNGFGLGGYYSRRVTSTLSVLLDLSLGAGKDERELKFSNRFGTGFIPNKRNYLLMLPLQLGVQQRLFADAIEDNFRPYLYFATGPTFGWEYPYFDDIDGDDRYDGDIDRRYDVISAFPRGRLRMGVGGTVALGANFGLSRRVTQGVRVGYAFHYFFEPIQLLEPDVKAPQRFFQTPIITISFGRLL